ncbi:MAG: hypothetical protein ABI855_03665 [Bacteroidota bacterium]
MSDKKSIEHLFTEALSKASAHPPKGAKEDIRKKLMEEGLLKKDTSSKRFFFWLFGISALAILSVTFVFYMKDSENKMQQTTAQAQQNNKEPVSDKNAENNSDVKQKDFRIENSETPNGAKEDHNGSDERAKNNSAKTEKHNDDNKNDSGILAKTVKKTNDGTSNIRGEKNSIANGEKNKYINQRKKDSSINENNFKLIVDKNGNSETFNNNDETKIFASEINNNTDKKQNQEGNVANPSADSSNGEANNLSENENKHSENEFADGIAQQQTDTSKAEEKKQVSLADSVSKEKKKNKFSVDIFGAAQINSFQYQSSNADFQPLEDESKKSETVKTSFGAGLGICIPFKNFFAEPGINYSFLKSDFSHTISQVNIDTSGSHYNFVFTQVYVNDSNGIPTDSFLVHSDSTWITLGDTSVLKIPVNSSNKITILEIPLWIGYKFSAGKFDIEIKAGASVSFITTVNTTLLYPYSDSTVVFNDIKNSPYRKNYFSILAGANLLYNINDRFSIFLQPSFKYGLGSIFKNDYPISKKIQNSSLGAGLRINF